MNRALAAVLCCLAVCGCLGAPSATPTATGVPADTPALTPTPTAASNVTATPTASAVPSGSDAPTTTGGNVSVAYVVRLDSVPAHVANVTVEFEGVYFAEQSDDLIGCAGVSPLMDNRYDPTPTPLPTPAGACQEFPAPTVELNDTGVTHSLGTFEASGRFDGGHMLVVGDVRVVLANGTEPTQVYDTDFRASHRESRPEGTVGVGFTITYDPRPGEARDYVVGVDHFDPDA